MIIKLFQEISIILVFIGNVLSESPCDDWEPYKDETCIKVFNSPGLLSYDDATAYCVSQGVNLVAIDAQEKQDFIENFVKSNSIADNVWLGLKYSDKEEYKWSDGTPFLFANWGTGSPKNDSSYYVQIHVEEEEFGKWSEVVCTKRNVVLCEKLQPWSSSKVQKTLMNMMKNPPIPMGFIYVQLPKEKQPSEIWPLLGWSDVSSEYAGVFFRAEGGNSSLFGEVQEENAPRLVYVNYHSAENLSGYVGTLDLLADNQESKIIRTGVYSQGFTYQTGLSFKTSSGEVRPRNMAIRIWKRIE